MNKNEKKQYRKDGISIVFLFSLFVFCILCITVAIVMLFWYILRFAGVIVDDFSIGLLILLMSITSLVVGCIVTIITIRVPLKPILELVYAMNRLSQGKYETRIKFGKVIGKHPAMNRVSESFNALARELENTEMLRSDFINNFSHEFKTPIVSILGFTRLLKKSDNFDEIKDEYLNIIEEESLRLTDMATNVLNMTKVENQTILTDKSVYNLSEQIRNCVLMLEAKWEKKKIEVVLDFDEYEVEGNEELLKQVWINLLDNAIKFANEYGVVRVWIEKFADKLRVTVGNTGSFVGENDRIRIFSKFYQADKSHSSEGSGLGLAIAKHIVNLHKGDIYVVSSENMTKFVVEVACA